MSTLLPLESFTRWLAFGERGLSSEAIVAHLTGCAVGSRSGGWKKHHPYDPDDFRRCQLLLESVPLARLTFSTMRTASPEWARLVDVWDEIHAAIEEDAPGYMQSPRGKSSRRGYALIKRALHDGVACANCDGFGRSDECEKCKGTGRRAGGTCRAPECDRGFQRCGVCRGEGYTIRSARAVSA